jgi:hypothetical protein
MNANRERISGTFRSVPPAAPTHSTPRNQAPEPEEVVASH